MYAMCVFYRRNRDFLLGTNSIWFLFPLRTVRPQLLSNLCRGQGAAAASPDAASVQYIKLCRFRRETLIRRMEEGSDLSLTIAQIVQRLKGSHLHSQIERQAKVSGLAN